MILVEVLCALLLPALGVGALVMAESLRFEANAIDTQLACTRARRAEAQRTRDAQAQLEQAQALTELVVHGTNATVRAVHEGVAAIPFGILEAMPTTRAPAKFVRGVHDLIAGAVYDAIAGGNKLLGAAARSALKSGDADKPP
jgi:hypothetical protein